MTPTAYESNESACGTQTRPSVQFWAPCILRERGGARSHSRTILMLAIRPVDLTTNPGFLPGRHTFLSPFELEDE